jgi:hypothetical protein
LGPPAPVRVAGAAFDHELEHVSEFNDYHYIEHLDQHHIDDESNDAVNWN